MSNRDHVPIRTCIGCREKKSKREMIWLTQSAAGVVVVNGRKPHRGRGFYLCSDRCLQLAKKWRKGTRRLETEGLRFPSAKGFEEGAKGWNMGGRE